MTYRRHLDLLTVPVYSPTQKRTWWITPQQYRVAARIGFQGQRFTVRKLAEDLDLPKSVVADAIRSLVSGGLLSAITRLGRNGFTFAKMRIGALVETNVRQRGNGLLDLLGNRISRSPKRGDNPRSQLPDISDDDFDFVVRLDEERWLA